MNESYKTKTGQTVLLDSLRESQIVGLVFGRKGDYWSKELVLEIEEARRLGRRLIELANETEHRPNMFSIDIKLGDEFISLCKEKVGKMNRVIATPRTFDIYTELSAHEVIKKIKGIDKKEVEKHFYYGDYLDLQGLREDMIEVYLSYSFNTLLDELFPLENKAMEYNEMKIYETIIL